MFSKSEILKQSFRAAFSQFPKVVIGTYLDASDMKIDNKVLLALETYKTKKPERVLIRSGFF